jgi:hypothetical protein
MTSNTLRAKLLRRLAKLDQMIQEVDDSMTGVTLTPTIFVRGVNKIHHMERSRAKVEVQLMQLKKQ